MTEKLKDDMGNDGGRQVGKKERKDNGKQKQMKRSGAMKEEQKEQEMKQIEKGMICSCVVCSFRHCTSSV